MSHHHPSPNEEAVYHEELASQERGHEHHVHVTPYWPMLIVFVVLVSLTVFTVLTAKYVALPGKGNLILALAIAVIKASLVFGYFMHLRYDKLINTVVIVASLFALLLFLGFPMLDLHSRREFNRQIEHGEIRSGGSAGIVANANAAATEHATHADDHAPEHADDAPQDAGGH